MHVLEGVSHFSSSYQRGAGRGKSGYVYLVPQLITKDVSKNLLQVKAIIIQAVDDNECDKKSRCKRVLSLR